MRSTRPLGARRPKDDRHLERYPFAAVPEVLSPGQVDAKLAQGVRSELPGWHPSHDQATQPSCVGHATVMERAIVNLAQRRKRATKPYTVRYDPIHVWRRAKDRDEWPESHSGEDAYGTSARAAYDVLRTDGAVPVRGVRVENGKAVPWGARRTSLRAGVVGVNYWCGTVDDVRRAYAEGHKAVPIALPWYSGFEGWSLEQRNDANGRSRWWMRPDPRSYGGGQFRGFHEICSFGADDRIDAIWIKNSWPEWGERGVALLPYAALEDCWRFWAEAVVVADR